jgi:hypothetical protein
VQTLVHSLESVDADVSAEPTSFKYQAALKDQVEYKFLCIWYLDINHGWGFVALT